MADAQYIAGRVQMARARCKQRDQDHLRIKAIRAGQYEKVAPGLFNTTDFPQPLVANLIDTTARDVAEVMAPLPTFNCQSASLSNDSDQKRQDMRAAIANAYVQKSRLQNQMFSGADRFNSFGFMAYMVESDSDEQMPVIKVSSTSSAYYTLDYLGRCRQYFEVFRVSPRALCGLYPDHTEVIEANYGHYRDDQTVEVVRWHDANEDCVYILDDGIELYSAPNPLGKCMVVIVERPDITDQAPRGQFDDVIWVQIARGVVQMYTMEAVRRSVEAPVVLPSDVQHLDLGPFAAIQTDNPQGVGTVPLQISPGLFPEASALQQEQLQGSRYPEGRSGSPDASIITGAGMNALMGTFNTQVQTFQRLNASAMEDVIGICFELDEKLWPNVEKTMYIKDNGAPRQFKYTPSKDIKGNHVVDVSYGAIAGLDPNRGLIFVLQSMAGGLISKATGRRSLGGVLDLNIPAEERQMQLEQMDDSIAASLAALPQLLPQMLAQGMGDPRESVLQWIEIRDLVAKGKSPAEAAGEVFAPKEQPQAAPADPMAAMQEQAAGAGLPGQGTGGASDLLMSLAGMTAGGQPNMQSNVSRRTPI